MCWHILRNQKVSTLLNDVLDNRDAQEMPDQCSFQVSLRLNFQGSHLNTEQASDTEHFLSQEKEFMSN